MELQQESIKDLKQDVLRPNYDRSNLKTGVVHIGVGGFHRSHQAFYLHRLMQVGKAFDWAICGLGLREEDRGMLKDLKQQDGLYTLLTQHPDGKNDCEVIGSMKEMLLAPDDPQAAIAKLAHPDTRIVGLTITEGGYNFNPTTGHFDFSNPDIVHDLTQPAVPKSVYGYLVEALRRRKRNGIRPFTVLSCDNIQGNGSVLRRMTLAFVLKQDPDMAKYIADHVSFPNSMVDRITPVTSPEIKEVLERGYGIVDRRPVVCEPFIQWVVEDDFSNGRPELGEVGVQFVNNVAPYELMKIRLLNAGHSVIGIPGAISGLPTIDACMQDGIFKRFLRRFLDEEATPVLGKIQGFDMEGYKDDLMVRFANPNIKDNVSRICSQSSAKLPKFLIPTLRINLAYEGSIRFATFVLAAWCYYSDVGKDEKGRSLEIIDDNKETLHLAAWETKTNLTAFLEQPELFGDLTENVRFVKEYVSILVQIYEQGDIRSLMKDLFCL
ncbi:mannitol dehydrogenase family protein [Flagellimonas sp. DF-77]|uniref:mannitol dehydrogenase family protein n=1 Tax=Flagellimonas algarum TaxID=3230298 RepID=UPI003399B6F6